jgi:hypothetical protein
MLWWEDKEDEKHCKRFARDAFRYRDEVRKRDASRYRDEVRKGDASRYRDEVGRVWV